MEPNTYVDIEANGRHHKTVAAPLHSDGSFVSLLDSVLIKQSGAVSLRKVKSNLRDALICWKATQIYTGIRTLKIIKCRVSISIPTFLNNFCRHTGSNTICRNTFCHNRISTNNYSIANCYIWHYTYISSNPNVISYLNFSFNI